jgi:pyrimidine-nucleoside phosphorylase
MRAIDIIAKKRDGAALSRDEISFVIRGYTSGEIADYQMAALVMAIYLRGMSADETVSLTDAMLHSGTVLDSNTLGRKSVDKHSTGGVGDKTSLVVAPVVAAAGVLVPMISGRALGHSGGTLDKLEAIPGFRTDLTLDEFRKTLERVGASMIGQTAEIAPADRKLYALRDVTATVACPPLMAASIMSKKMAEGISGLVLDVKTGSGAFLKREHEGAALANLMIGIAQSLDKKAVALLTDMNQPLGYQVGNSIEVIESLETLKGRGPRDLNELCRELAAEMLLLGGVVVGIEEGRARYDDSISNGAALDKFRAIIEAQSGDPRVVDNYDLLPHATRHHDVGAASSGYVTAIDTEKVGIASMLLGAGRLTLSSRIDYGVGITVRAKIGDEISAGSPVVTLHFNGPECLEEAVAIIANAYTISPEPPAPRPLIKSRLDSVER